MQKPTPTRIVFVGAGSAVFTRTLVADLLLTPELGDLLIVLHDIDPKRLALAERAVNRLIDELDAKATVVATTDRSRALDGADFVFNTIQVGGYRPATVTDFAVPKRFGLEQTIGDTLGIGGIFRAVRTVPVMQAIVKDMERLCPDALHLNYVNPMAMVCWALSEASSVRTVGLCHSVQGTVEELAEDLGLPADEIGYVAAGINHLAFYLRLEHAGEDLYPRLHVLARSGRAPEHNRVRYDALTRLGYFVTESSEHFAEYVPWYLKRSRPEVSDALNIPIDEYLARCRLHEIAWDYLERELDAPGSVATSELREAVAAADLLVMPRSREHAVGAIDRLREARRSHEYGATIVRSVVTGEPSVVYGNVPNADLLPDLPAGCCVEVPCLVDGNGVQPTAVGELPPQLAALMRTNVGVQQLVVAALRDGRRDHLVHAAMLDPRTAMELVPDEIAALVDALIEAHGELIPEALRAR